MLLNALPDVVFRAGSSSIVFPVAQNRLRPQVVPPLPPENELIKCLLFFNRHRDDVREKNHKCRPWAPAMGKAMTNVVPDSQRWEKWWRMSSLTPSDEKSDDECRPWLPAARKAITDVVPESQRCEKWQKEGHASLIALQLGQNQKK